MEPRAQLESFPRDPWATTKINRKDFGLTWNTTLETGGILVGDDITITLDAQQH
jgi:polyisoprenoid-binding protein YceI